MKVATILGTRPEIIRLSRIIPQLDQNCTHVLVHTGQNYSPGLGDIFFKELNLRQPDYYLECKAQNPMEQVSKIIKECDRVLTAEKPDRLLILGDTNSALCAIAAKRHHIPVFHMEAGNRCFDDRVPEEVNRRIVDHCSDVLLPYTERSRANLLREGISCNRIFVTGNPIKEVLDFYAPRIEDSQIVQNLGLKSKEYMLVTLHRAENVDRKERLEKFIQALKLLLHEFALPVICSLHPHTRWQLYKSGIILKETGITFIEPVGLFDFVSLEKQAFCVLSDSGTVQEECCLFNIPNITLRDVTERPETIEAGSGILSGCEAPDIVQAVKMARTLSSNWRIPEEYLRPSVSGTVIKILLGYYSQ
jgi:UDP-N-acetylglucosamine 2-epimerase